MHYHELIVPNVLFFGWQAALEFTHVCMSSVLIEISAVIASFVSLIMDWDYKEIIRACLGISETSSSS